MRLKRGVFYAGINWLRTACIIQGAYKLSEDFAKPYFHKY